MLFFLHGFLTSLDWYWWNLHQPGVYKTLWRVGVLLPTVFNWFKQDFWNINSNLEVKVNSQLRVGYSNFRLESWSFRALLTAGSLVKNYPTIILYLAILRWWPFWDGEDKWPFPRRCWWPSTFGDKKVTAWITWYRWFHSDFCVFWLGNYFWKMILNLTLARIFLSNVWQKTQHKYNIA